MIPTIRPSRTGEETSHALWSSRNPKVLIPSSSSSSSPPRYLGGTAQTTAVLRAELQVLNVNSYCIQRCVTIRHVLIKLGKCIQSAHVSAVLTFFAFSNHLSLVPKSTSSHYSQISKLPELANASVIPTTVNRPPHRGAVRPGAVDLCEDEAVNLSA